MSEVASVGRAAVRGGAALAVRQVLIQGTNIVTGILLARWLDPATFGVYGLMAFVLTFLIAVGDVGLGASLVRQQHLPSRTEYRVVFTFQQLSTSLLALLMWCIAPAAAQFFHLGAAQVWLFRGAGVALFLTSFQTLPAIRLERELAFHRLAVMEVLQAVVYNGCLIIGVVLGWGPLTFALALVLRAFSGALYINVRHPWPIGWTWNWAVLRPHLAFGLPYQGISFVSLIKDSITPILIGGLIGLQAVGYVNWSQTVAAYPVMALMVLQRLYMPLFSRLQFDPSALRRALNDVLFLTNTLTAVLAVTTVVAIVPMIQVIFGIKWFVALPAFYLFWISNIFVATATPLLALLNSLGHSRQTFGFALIWLVSTWLLGVPLLLRFGVVGFAVANLGVQLTNLLLFRLAWKKIAFAVWPSVIQPWLVSGVVGLLLAGAMRWYTPGNIATLLMFVLLSVVVQAAAFLLLPGTRHQLARRFPKRRLA